MITSEMLEKKFTTIWPHLDERAKRLFAANEARQLGYGGITKVSRACGLSRVTITRAMVELDEAPIEAARIRRSGGGRRNLVDTDPGLKDALEKLVEPLSRGDPESPLRWTIKSTRTLAEEMKAEAHPLSHEKVAQILRSMDYSLQGNRKTEEGADHPDRDAQFRHINGKVKTALDTGQPVISVDTKKKELLGNYVNTGRQWRPQKTPKKVNGHDFPDPSIPRALPYGIYDPECVNIDVRQFVSIFDIKRTALQGWD